MHVAAVAQADVAQAPCLGNFAGPAVHLVGALLPNFFPQAFPEPAHGSNFSVKHTGAGNSAYYQPDRLVVPINGNLLIVGNEHALLLSSVVKLKESITYPVAAQRDMNGT